MAKNPTNPHAVALGRLGGLARAESLSPEEISAIARKAGREGGKKGGRMKLSPERRREIARAGGKASAAARAKKARSQKGR